MRREFYTRPLGLGLLLLSASLANARIASSSSRNNLLTTAYVNTDGKLAVVVMNKTDEDIDYKLWIKGKAAKTKSLAHSIATVVIE